MYGAIITAIPKANKPATTDMKAAKYTSKEIHSDIAKAIDSKNGIILLFNAV